MSHHGVEVVEFHDPSKRSKEDYDRRKKRRKKRSHQLEASHGEKRSRGISKSTPSRGSRGDGDTDFDEIWSSVQALGASQLRGWRKRQWKEAQWEAVGGKRSRNQKMPVKMRMGIMKKRLSKTKRKQEGERLADLVTGYSKNQRKVRVNDRANAGRGGKERQRKDVLDKNKLRGGVLFIGRKKKQKR